MKVLVISGQHRGLSGDINGDFSERKKTLGKDGKVMVRFAKNNFPVFIRLKHLVEDDELPLWGNSPDF